MTTSFASTYTRVALISLGTAVAIALLGYFPTLRLAGDRAIASMVAGIAVSLVAGCVSAVPIAAARSESRTKGPQAILLATTIRFLVALLLTASILLSGGFEKSVLVVWVGISYLLMLGVETLCSIRILGSGDADRGDAGGPGGRDEGNPPGSSPRKNDRSLDPIDTKKRMNRHAVTASAGTIPRILPRGASA